MKTKTEVSHPESDIVGDIKANLLGRLASHIHLLVLYGSEARGEARPDSDVDLLVVLREEDPELMQMVRDVVYDVMWRRDFDRLVSTYVMSKARYEAQKRRGYSFMKTVEDEGIELWRAA